MSERGLLPHASGPPDAYLVAQAFHEVYEELAPAFDYRTREESAKPWEQVPDQNKRLMVATVEKLMQRGVVVPVGAGPDTVERVRQVLARGFYLQIHDELPYESAAREVVAAVGQVGVQAVGPDPVRGDLERARAREDGQVGGRREITDEWVRELRRDALDFAAGGPLPEVYVRRIAEKVLEAAALGATAEGQTP